jgi:hypothetical protein
MILTVRDDYNKNEGVDLPMFSRSGKSTSSYYIAFNTKNKNRHIQSDRNDEKDDEDMIGQDDIGLMMGENPKNIAADM